MKARKILSAIMAIAMIAAFAVTASAAEKQAESAAFVAKIGEVEYESLQAAISKAIDGDTIYLIGTINEGSVKLPAVIKNLTIDGQDTAIVKDTIINAADGNSVNYQGLTIKNTTFDNSRFVLGGVRNGDVIYKDIVFDNNRFIDIVNTASMAAIHMNLASDDNEYIENFTFTNNVIDGVTGSSNSGVLLKSITGDVVFEGNEISNVAWNAVQVATAKANAKLVVRNNSFTSSGSSVLNIAAAPSVTLENNTVVNDSGRVGIWYSAEARIGNTEYTDLQTAVNKAIDGDTITLLRNIEQTDGVTITDKKLTLDLAKYTFTVTEGSSTNSRNFLINGSSVVTIKNGTLVGAGDINSGTYGTIRADGAANVTLTGLKLYNYRGNGLNIKALTGTTVNVSDTEIYSTYGGGIEAAGAKMELTNVTVDQKGLWTAPYNSMAISVNSGGTVIVNSGEYRTEPLTAEDAHNQGSSHGSWAAGVLNSGGTLIIKGGTFTNGNYGDDSLAIAARGLILADTGANIQIEDGTFNALKSVIDIQNNLGDASKNPTGTIIGGTFSADPTNNYVKIADGYTITENSNGTYGVVEEDAKTDIFGEKTAYINDITYQQNSKDFYSVILFAGIDNLNYREVGFKVTVDGTTKEQGTNTVYTEILASDENGEVITVKPENFGGKVNYIFGQRYEFDGDFKTSALTFCPYAIDTNGNYIYGEEETIEKIYSK